jgi:hypothetical protein
MPIERSEGVPRAMLKLAGSLGAGWWLLAAAITSGTNLLDFFAAAQPDAARSLLFVAAALVRALLVFWLAYALIRRMAGTAEPMKPTFAFLRFALFMLGTVFVLGAATGLGTVITGAPADSAAAGIAAFLIITLVSVALVRLFAWQAALAVGDRTLGPAGAWRGLAGLMGGLVAAYLIVAAVSAAHGFLTRLAIASADAPAALVALAVVDGLVSAVQLMLGCALAVAAWRLARDRSGALREDAAVA